MSQQNTPSPPLTTPDNIPKTDNPEPKSSAQEQQELNLGIMQLLIDTNSLIEVLENVIFEIQTGRIPQEQISGKMMPLCALFDALQDEHPRLDKLNEDVGDAWATQALVEVETALMGMGQDFRKLLLPEETNAEGDRSVEDEDARGERHFELALQQLGSFGLDCIYGV